MERTSSFASFAKVREAILDIRAQGDSTAHSGRSLSARAKIGKPKQREFARSPEVVTRNSLAGRSCA